MRVADAALPDARTRTTATTSPTTYGVDPRLGDLGDVAEAIRHANDRGLRVLADLVVNHTSIEHPWFQAARASRESPYRDYYVWTDDPAGAHPGTTEEQLDLGRAAGQHYMHRFQPFQPDLNIANPAVRERDHQDVGFWLQLGVSGFRMDAVPFLFEEVGGDRAPTRATAGAGCTLCASTPAGRRADAMLMGEVNVDAGGLAAYFEDHGDALHLQLGFLINQRLWLSLARGEAAPLEDLIRRLPVPPHDSGWATFLRNHDELTLDKLYRRPSATTSSRRSAPSRTCRSTATGSAVALASMLGGDGPRLRMAWSLMLALPGTPVLLYGDEIGMGEELALEGRMSVRTPMQWAPGPTGGFSSAEPGRLVRPLPGATSGPTASTSACSAASPGRCWPS